MNAREILIDALETEIDNADFTTEESQDGSYQLAITKITEIFREYTDDSITLHDIVEIVNILDDLELTLLQAYKTAIEYLQKGELDE